MAATKLRALLLLVLVGVAFAERHQGGSLRGALEALQRRQRARTEHPRSLLYREPQPSDYEDALVDLYGPVPQYDDEPYSVDQDDFGEVLPQKYIIKYLNEDEPNRDFYESKKKKDHPEHKEREEKQSAFRERAHKHDNEDDRLKQLFAENEEETHQKNKEAQLENNAEYAILLDRLWSKYKTRHPNNVDGVVKLYKERNIKKREYPDDDGWGPVAFKRKRSAPENDSEDTEDYPVLEYPLRPDDRYKYTNDDNDNGNDDSEDLREELIAFQPLEGDKIELPTDGRVYTYGTANMFPVTKRSTEKRSTGSQKYPKKFRSGLGTDPKVIQDLSKIFGEPADAVKSPVKRSNKMEESHETKAPQITAAPHNHSHDYNFTHIREDESHEHQGHAHGAHPPNVSGKEESLETEQSSKPIALKKKSIDWSQYFGIDKRNEKSATFRSEANVESYRKQYEDTFNREMGFHNKVKRNYNSVPIDESEFEIDRVRLRSEAKRNVEGNSKLENIDRKLAGVESAIVDEALHMASVGDMDSKEQQELKEKMLSRLAAAYSLEKMRKALKDFKQTLNIHKESKISSEDEKVKDKRVAVKKEKAELKETAPSKSTKTANTLNEEFEGEQGAGHYINGEMDEPYSEGYMGGSGRHRAPAKYEGAISGECPVLERIVQRCRGIDILSGDQGQLFLPLCSLHQICYLCGESAPTTCDLIFLSEADTACEGDGACSRAARTSLMAMRELHESQSDDLDGECEASPCLANALRQNLGWSRAIQR